MISIATIGAKALYFLFLWLISATVASWLSERKGYGERLGLTLGLLLSAVGLLIALLLPGRPGSKWRAEGWLPQWRRRHAGQFHGDMRDRANKIRDNRSGQGD